MHIPGLKKDEKAIWLVAQQLGLFKGHVEFDVCVGEGFVHTKAALTPAEEHMCRSLTMKRIDVVEDLGNVINIIEITPRVSSRALGQLHVYEDLYRKKFSPRVPLNKILLASQDDADVSTVANKMGVTVILV